VTEASLEYEGSITIDLDLMDAAKLLPYERVEVNGKLNPARIATYVIPGERGSGIIAMNGGAAQHFEVGDKVHVLCYGQEVVLRMADKEYPPNPIIVHTDKHNRIR